MCDNTKPERWQFVFAGIFALAFVIGGVGIFLPSLANKEYALALVVISAGAMLLALALPRIAGFKIGLKGVEAKLAKVDVKMDDLNKLQLEMAHELNRDLISKRFDVYGELWSRMQCLAKYTEKPFSRNDASELWEDLSGWYFSADGGLFLTERAREFYFSLQDILKIVKDTNYWQCDKRPPKPEKIFKDMLKELSPDLQVYCDGMKKPGSLDENGWRKKCCKSIGAMLESLANEQQPVPNVGDKIYSTIQQVSSVLRSNLAHDLRSRFNEREPEMNSDV